MKGRNKIVQVEILVGDAVDAAAADQLKEQLHDQAVQLAKPVNGMVESRIHESGMIQAEIVLGPRVDEVTAEGIKAQLRRQAIDIADTVHGQVRSRIVVEEQKVKIPRARC